MASIPINVFEAIVAAGEEAVAQRVKSRLVDGPGGCLLYVGHLCCGYGRISLLDRDVLVHRVMWALHHRADPGAMLVCHRCDVPQCCNPDHLFLGTYADNSRDMLAKGRGPYQSRPERKPRNPRAKLTDAQRMAIMLDKRPPAEVLADYPISRGHLNRLRAGKTSGSSGATITPNVCGGSLGAFRAAVPALCFAPFHGTPNTPEARRDHV